MSGKYRRLIGLPAVGLTPAASTRMSQPAEQQGWCLPWWVWLLLILLAAFLFVLWWWWRPRSRAKVVPPAPEPPKPYVPAKPAPTPEVTVVEKPVPPVAEMKVPEKPTLPVAEVKVPEKPAPVVEMPVVEKPAPPVAEVKVPEKPVPPVVEVKVPEKPTLPVAEVKVPEKPTLPAAEVKVPEKPTPVVGVTVPAKPAPVVVPVPAKPVLDDLAIVEGIGPKIASLFQAAGITTFAQLAATDVARLRQIIREADIRTADPTTWPEQARLAAAGEWDKLKALQEQLRGGRRVVVPVPAKRAPDDLAIVEGIGPKIASLFQAAGITTFAQLAATDVERLRQILRAADIRIADPTTWPEQARLAAAGEWDKLKALQEQLKGGRRV